MTKVEEWAIRSPATTKPPEIQNSGKNSKIQHQKIVPLNLTLPRNPPIFNSTSYSLASLVVNQRHAIMSANLKCFSPREINPSIHLTIPHNDRHATRRNHNLINSTLSYHLQRDVSAMSHSRRRTESEKSYIGDPINLESLEAQDVITPLSPIRSVHRHTSLGKLPPASISLRFSSMY